MCITFKDPRVERTRLDEAAAFRATDLEKFVICPHLSGKAGGFQLLVGFTEILAGTGCHNRTRVNPVIDFKASAHTGEGNVYR